MEDTGWDRHLSFGEYRWDRRWHKDPKATLTKGDVVTLFLIGMAARRSKGNDLRGSDLLHPESAATLAVELLRRDFLTTLGRLPPVGLQIDDHGNVRVTWHGEPNLDDGGGLFSLAVPNIVVEVAAQAQSMLMQSERIMWPLCPTEGVPAEPTVILETACWACSGHIFAEIGSLTTIGS